LNFSLKSPYFLDLTNSTSAGLLAPFGAVRYVDGDGLYVPFIYKGKKKEKENESVIINWNIAYPFQSLNKLTVFLSLAVQWDLTIDII
jgi:hypothetical protein